MAHSRTQKSLPQNVIDLDQRRRSLSGDTHPPAWITDVLKDLHFYCASNNLPVQAVALQYLIADFETAPD